MKPILISISPNTEKDDVFLALKVLFTPWKWKDEKYSRELENVFLSATGMDGFATAVNSGRSALYLILKALEVGANDEVIVQAFTCVAVPNSAIWNGAKPVFVDIDETYNIDPDDLKKKITNKTKAIIVQHTFGIPAKFIEIKEIADKRGVVIIEDCAHSLGSTYHGKKLGSLGEVSLYSFGRDKCVSSVFGGMIFTKNEKLAEKIRGLENKLPQPSLLWIKQQLYHPVAMSFIKPLYNFGIGKFALGKFVLIFFQKLKLLSFPVYESEKSCGHPNVFPSKMPGALSILAVKQLKKLNKFVKHRKAIVKIYEKSLSNKHFTLPPISREISYLRYPIRHGDSRKILDKFKSEGILLGDWYNKSVVPVYDLNCVGYTKGSCPKAEKMANEIINLPTYINLTGKDAKHIVSKLNG